MTSHFEEEHFLLGEKSNHMVMVTPFMGKVKCIYSTVLCNGNGEMKPAQVSQGAGPRSKITPNDDCVFMVSK